MPARILIVDDDPVVIRMVGDVLEENHYEVLSATEGNEAIEKIQDERPDLIVLDVMLPGINGYDICYRLRFDKEFEKIPIVLVTVREEEIHQWIRERLRIEYLPKPINTTLLLEKIKSLLAEKEKN